MQNFNKRDLIAGMAVFFVAVPLCLGVAKASGAPPVAGLLSGIIGGIVIGLLSGSPLSVSGPAAGLTTIVLAGLDAVNKNFSQFLVAVFLAGLLQMVLGRMKAGALNRLFPSPVIKGMLAAIGLILVLKQVPHLVGYDAEAFGADSFNDEFDPDYPDAHPARSNTFSVFWWAVSHVQPGAFIIGLISLGLLFFWDKKLAKKIPTVPGSLVAVVTGVLLNQLFHLTWPGLEVAASHMVHIPKLTDGVLTLPDWSALSNPAVWRLALTIGLVASIESLLSLEAIERLDPLSRGANGNRELYAQGAGNCLCGLLGGIPVTSVIVRSSVNLAAGASSRISTIAHGCYLVLALVFFAGLMNQVPLATLAAVLVHVGLKMASPQTFRELRRKGMQQLVPFVATIAAVLLTDLLIGIAIGLCVSAIFILKSMYASSGFDLLVEGDVTRVVLHQEVTFFHKARLSQFFESLPPHSTVEIDGSLARSVDPDVVDVIDQFRRRAVGRNIELIVGRAEQLKDIGAQYHRLAAPNPQILFIGCSDSRVAAEAITKRELGDLHVHRNLGNLVSAEDVELSSVVQYSLENLSVPEIILCGHYGCAAVRAAMSERSFGLIDNWVQPIKELARSESDERRLVELNVLQQARNLLELPAVKKARPTVRAWVLDGDGVVDLSEELERAPVSVG